KRERRGTAMKGEWSDGWFIHVSYFFVFAVLHFEFSFIESEVALSRYVLCWTNTTKLHCKSTSVQTSNTFHSLFSPNIVDFHSTLLFHV
ncbi:hypothetical protein VIGAN_06267900, partial [Vigna angularis var. angularis]